jgi:Mannosyl-glycoprotein endo-beta-N-acetylglucosaminidase
VHPISKPWWEQVTALVTLSISGAITGFSFVPRSAAELKSPAGMPIHLLALEQAARPKAAGDTMLRAAIINVANHFLHMAAGMTPAEMQALIWQHDSVNGVDHGASCAAFASLTLELASRALGQQSWVTGGTTYPWPLHKWVDARVDPNPASPGITSVLQDAQAQHRWHPLGDGYAPLPGDWVLFDGHVEVVTSDANGVLNTIGGDSLPNFSVNAHQYPAPLAAQGVVGFVDNGVSPGVASQVAGGGAPVAAQHRDAAPGDHRKHPAGGHSRPVPASLAQDIAGGQGQPVPGSPAQDVAGREGQPVPSSLAQNVAGGLAPPVPGSLVQDVAGGYGQGIPGAPEQTVAAGHGQPVHGGPAPATAGGHGQHVHGTLANSAADGQGQPVHGRPAPAVAGGQRVHAPGSHAGHGTAGRSGRPAGGPPERTASDPRGWLASGPRPVIPGAPAAGSGQPQPGIAAGDVAIPGAPAPPRAHWDHGPARPHVGHPASATPHAAAPAAVLIPGLPDTGSGPMAAPQPAGAGRHSSPDLYRRHLSAGPATSSPETRAQLAFIARVAPGAIAAERRYGVPAAVTIAQAIDESGWGQSMLASKDHNLFGIKGLGPAGSDLLPTQEYQNGQLVPSTTEFRVYHSIAESIDDHGKLLATSRFYRHAMAERHDPNAFAAALTGIYATDPQYGTKLINLMREYDLYRYDLARPGAARQGAGASRAARAAPPQVAPVTVLPSAGPSAGRQHPARQHAPPGHTPHASRGQTPRGPAPAVQAPAPAASAVAPGGPDIPGLPPVAGSSAQTTAFVQHAVPVSRQPPRNVSRPARAKPPRYQQHIPASVWTALITTAKMPLLRGEPLYRDIASLSGVRWELLAACDWMQCRARPGYSPAHGEKLGAVNADGTIYRTRSEALEQCAYDLVQLAGSVYQIDAAAPDELSVRDLASVFAAFRWGALLQQHHTSAMEFPYSVAGLTVQHLNMRWPNIADPNTPDKAGGRFRQPFGAVPIALILNYRATV